MSNPSLTRMLHAAIAARFADIDLSSGDKTHLLFEVLQRAGPTAVFEIGYFARTMPPHPVIDTLLRGQNPTDILQRWMRLERFGHTRNRTRLISSAAGRLTIEHYALDGGAIEAVNDLFVWGLLVGLLTRAGVGELQAELSSDSGGIVLFDGHEIVPADVVQKSDRLRLRWNPRAKGTPKVVEPPSPGQVSQRLGVMITEDLAMSWTLEKAAQGLGFSTRTLQRRLLQEGEPFAAFVQKQRLYQARSMLEQRHLSLTEIAFCTGFSDQAHFTRSFKKHYDVPPTAYRDLL